MSEIIEKLKGPQTAKELGARLTAIENELDTLLHEFRRLCAQVMSEMPDELFTLVLQNCGVQWVEADKDSLDACLCSQRYEAALDEIKKRVREEGGE